MNSQINSPKPEIIHIFVGTKAQFIKMAPIMQALDKRSIPYNFIDAGQHAGLTGTLIDQFGLRQPDVRLRTARSNISTLLQAVLWLVQSLLQLLFRKQQIFQSVFGGKRGICLIHGDTLTTLLSLLYARRCGLRVAHVEAGLRSYNLFNPFPEEIIRIIAMRFSHVLFTPSQWAFENLTRMGYQDKAINVGGNTGLDAVRYALAVGSESDRPDSPYVVVTTHRVETLYSRTRLTAVVELLTELIDRYSRVMFFLHEPTLHQLQRFGLYERLLANPAIEMRPLQPYLQFINLVAGAELVVTDGGSIQEESFFLGVPCLVMRTKTERVEGLGENVYLSGFDAEKTARFFDKLPHLKRPPLINSTLQPSTAIVDSLLLLLSTPIEET